MPKQSKVDTPRRTSRATRPSPTKPKQTRQPQHCKKCEGHPLRSQCQHTQIGRVYLQQHSETEVHEAESNESGLAPEFPVEPNQGTVNNQRTLENVQSIPISAEREEQRCNQCIGRPLRKQCCHTKAGQAYLHQQEVLADLNLHAQQVSTPIRTGRPSSPIIDPALQEQSFIPHSEPQIPPLNNSVMAPNPVWLSSPQEANPIIQNAPRAHNLVPDGNNSTDASSGAQNASEETLGPSERVKRTRPTAANPIYGHVEDVFRGDKPHLIHRSHALSDQISDRDKCQKYFLETINSIVFKCEDLSARTGCWLFIGAQHATARGAPVHFASPRLRRDAGDEISSFGSEFCTLMNHLMDARRRDTLDVRRNLEAVEIEKAELEKQVTLLHSQNADRDALLHRYRELFGDVAQPS